MKSYLQSDWHGVGIEYVAWQPIWSCCRCSVLQVSWVLGRAPVDEKGELAIGAAVGAAAGLKKG